MPVITPGDRDYLSDPSLLREVSKKNFIRENIKHLKQLQKKNRRDKKKSEIENEIPSVYNKRPLGRRKSQSKFVRKRIVESKSSKSLVKSAPRSPTTQIELVKISNPKHGRSAKHKKHAKTQGGGGDAQSFSEDEMTKKIYVPSQIEKKEKALQTQTKEPSITPFSPFSADDIKREMKATQDMDFVKLNQLVQYKPKKFMKNEKTDPNRAPPTYQRGVLPKYLREQKKESDVQEDRMEPIKEHSSSFYPSYSSSNQPMPLSGQASKKVTKSSTPTCPPGHILISDSERKQQLNEMRKHYADLINRLTRVGVHAENQKGRQMKTELENELESLEAAISLFSKDKLFLKI